MHAAGEDLRICLLETGSLPRRVFDVQMAAGLVGPQLSAVAGQPGRAGAGHQPGRQRDAHRLAASAAHARPSSTTRSTTSGYLLDLADHFTDRLTELGRTAWAEAEFDDFIESIAQRADEDRWRRLPGLHQLSRRSLEMARRLAEWREDEARRQNRPLRQVVRDDLLVAIAKRQPANRRGLEALRDFNRPALLNRSHEILAILDQARAVPEDQLPELAAPPRRAARPLDRHQPALRGPGPVLRAKPDRRLAGGQRRRSQAPGPLAPRRPRRFAPPCAAPRLAQRALRPALARCARRPTGPARRRPGERVPGRTRAGRRRSTLPLNGPDRSFDHGAPCSTGSRGRP